MDEVSNKIEDEKGRMMLKKFECIIIQLIKRIELNNNEEIRKLEFVAEEITWVVFYGYLHISNCTWSLPAKSTEEHLSFTA